MNVIESFEEIISQLKYLSDKVQNGRITAEDICEELKSTVGECKSYITMYEDSNPIESALNELNEGEFNA